VAYWLAEGGDKTPSKPKFKQLTLELQKLAALYYATDELLEDATALTQEVTEAFMDEMNFKIQDAIFRGDGAGKPQGILSSPSLVTVAKETGQLASTILYQNIVKMYSRFMGNNGIWIANRDIFPQLSQMSLAVGTGGAPAYMPANGLAGVPYNTLVGLPIIFIEQASTVGTEGDIVLADMGQYLVAEKGGIVGASSIHVEFTTGQTVFRWLYRIDGQTKTSSPITPANGTATVSPFISLATRA
jgi:HK97 family phage major capsid protein